MAKNNNHLPSNIDNFSIHKKYTHIFDIAFVKFGARLTCFKKCNKTLYLKEKTGF